MASPYSPFVWTGKRCPYFKTLASLCQKTIILSVPICTTMCMVPTGIVQCSTHTTTLEGSASSLLSARLEKTLSLILLDHFQTPLWPSFFFIFWLSVHSVSGIVLGTDRLEFPSTMLKHRKCVCLRCTYPTASLNTEPGYQTDSSNLACPELSSSFSPLDLFLFLF